MAPALIAPFIAIALGLFAWQLLQSWDNTMGPLLERLARAMEGFTLHIPRVGGHPLAPIGRAIRSAAAFVRREVGEWTANVSWPLAQFILSLTAILVGPVRALAAVADATGDALRVLRQHVIPSMIAAKVAWIPRHLAHLDADVARLLKRAPLHITKEITNYAKGAFVATTAIAVAWPRARIRTIEREIDALKKRGRSIVKRVPVALTAAALTAIVARTSFRWVRCAKVNRVGKRICGMDESLLDDLLAASLLVVGTVSLVQLFHEVEPVLDDGTEALFKFWRVTH